MAFFTVLTVSDQSSKKGNDITQKEPRMHANIRGSLSSCFLVLLFLFGIKKQEFFYFTTNFLPPEM